MTQKVLVKFGIDNPHTSSLYYLLREFDKEGKGWVKVPMELIQSLLNIKRRALINRLKKGVQDALFYYFEISRGNLYVKYVSQRILKELVYTNNFASVKLTGAQLLNINSYKQVLYGAAINRQQQACEKAINKKVNSTRKIINPYKYINSDYAHGCDYKTKDKLFIKSYINVAGASQITLGQYLDKTRATLNKWCNKFQSLKVWKRKKCLSENPSPDIYEITKVKKNGVKYKVQYKRLPNYYFVNNEVRFESKEVYKTIYSPAILHAQKLSQLELNEASIKAALSGKSNPGKTLTDKLLFWFKREQIILLACTLFEYVKGIKVPQGALDSKSTYDIANSIDRAQPLLNEVQLSHLLLLIRRLRKKMPIN